MAEVRRGYKGLDSSMRSTLFGYKYEVGKKYTTNEIIKASEGGFHATKRALDVLHFSPAIQGARFFEAEQSGEIYEGFGQCASSEIVLKRELSVEELIERTVLDSESGAVSSAQRGAAVAPVRSGAGAITTDDKSVALATFKSSGSLAEGEYSVACATDGHSVAITECVSGVSTVTGSFSSARAKGYCSGAISVGDYCSEAIVTNRGSVAAVCGSQSNAEAKDDICCAVAQGGMSTAYTTGNYSCAVAGGNFTTATAEGKESIAVGVNEETRAEAKGNRSVACTNGTGSGAAVQGKHSVALANGYRALASAGEKSIAFATGVGARAKGDVGAWLVLVEYDGDLNFGEMPNIRDIKAFYVDGKTVKADTEYRLENGELVEV